MRGGIDKKILIFGAVVLLLLTGLSSVYAGSISKESLLYNDETKSEGDMVTNSDTIDCIKDSFENMKNKFRHSAIGSYVSRFQQFRNKMLNGNRTLPTGFSHRQSVSINGESWDMIVPDDYPTIQQAVDAVNPQNGYCIFVRSGVYYENVVIDQDGITLHGETRDATIIDGGGYGFVLLLASSYNNISGFTIQNSGLDTAGIRLSVSSGNQIQGNKIVDNDGNGLWLYRSHANTVEDNLIADNGDLGILFDYSCLANIITDNQIENNEQGGILIDGASRNNLIAGNNVENNQVGVKCVGGSDGNMIHHNRFNGNNQNAYDNSSNTWDDDISEGNYWDDYTGVDANGDGIGDTSYQIPGGDSFDRFPLMNPPAMECYSMDEIEFILKPDAPPKNKDGLSLSSGDVIIVPDDYPTIQEAVSHAHAGDTIIVRAGIYYENVIVDKILSIVGDGAETTIVDGSSNNGHVFKITSDNVYLSGFKIQNTNLGLAGVKIKSNNCEIEDNLIMDCGDGINLELSTGTVIHGNRVTGNNFGIYADFSTDVVIEDDIIDRNGDGMCMWMADNVNIIGSEIGNNGFTGILHLWSSENHIRDNNIIYNGNTGLQMFSSNNNTAEGNNINNNSGDGISLFKSKKNLFGDNSIQNNMENGISFWFLSDNNYIYTNEIESNDDGGIIFDMSSVNFITENEIRNNYHGIILRVISNRNLISENNITKNRYGINLWILSDNNVITRNTIGKNTLHGIDLRYSSDNNLISENEITNNNNDGIHLESYSGNNTITWNTITINNDDGVHLESYSGNNTITWNTITINNNDGIHLRYSSGNNTIAGNKIVSNYDDGIYLESYSNNNLISENEITNNNDGIHLESYSNNNLISENEITNNKDNGIYIHCSSDNAITGNTITNNEDYGIYLRYLSNYNVITGNTITNNEDYGICLKYSSNYNLISRNTIIGIKIDIEKKEAINPPIYNKFYHNNIFQACDESNNIWDNGYPSGGNYWNYPNVDGDGDGIGDNPVLIPCGSNKDRYPYMERNGWLPKFPPKPDLKCNGSIICSSVKPGSTVTGNFEVKNVGEFDSELDWYINEFPSWGTWTFAPSSGDNLKPIYQKTTVQVSVVAPDVKTKNFSGRIVIVNKENTSDYEIIEVFLATPKNKPINTLFIRYLEHHPSLFQIFRHFFGLWSIP